MAENQADLADLATRRGRGAKESLKKERRGSRETEERRWCLWAVRRSPLATGRSPLAARCWPLAARAPARPNAARQLATRSSSLSTLRRSTNTFHLPQCSSVATRFIAQRFVLALEEPVSPLACNKGPIKNVAIVRASRAQSIPSLRGFAVSPW